MGSAASSGTRQQRIRETIRVTVVDSGKPLDGSDVKDLVEARQEIARLRSLALSLYELSDGPKLPVDGIVWQNAQNMIKGRGAVFAKEEHLDYEKRIFEKEESKRLEILQAIRKNILFTNCEATELEEIVDIFEPIEYSAGQTVIQRGDQGIYFYVVDSGTLDLYLFSNERQEEFKVDPIYAAGDCFGELALMYNQPRAATIKARTKCKLWQLQGSVYRAMKKKFKMESSGQSLSLLSNVAVGNTKLNDLLTSVELHQVASAFEIVEFRKGDVILREGEYGDIFYIIQHGEVEVYKHEEDQKTAENNLGLGMQVKLLTSGDYFGERALLSEEKRAASCVAKSDKVLCLTLDREDFILILGNIEEKQKSKKTASDQKESHVDESKVDINMEASSFLEVTLDDFEIGQTLGCGAFGSVKLIRRKADEKMFALKSQSLKLIIENSMQEHIISEKNVMMKLNHPFIIKLYTSFKDNRYIYFVMELLNGGELFTHLRRQRRFSETQAKFYTASVVLAFEEIHGMNMIYRDLKPENIVLDSQGYPKVVDFGLAKVMECPKTFTICGTPDYLAPEIILNEGHDRAVDYWALGVLIYELIYGEPPFYAEDPMQIYENIITGRLSLYSTKEVTPSRALASILKKLIKHSKIKRLGYAKGGISTIIKHKWFSGFDWDGLRKKQLGPPLVPKVESAEDISSLGSCDDDHKNAPICLDWDPEI